MIRLVVAFSTIVYAALVGEGDACSENCALPPMPANHTPEAIDEHIAIMSQYSQNHDMLQHAFLKRFQHGLFLDLKHAVRSFAKEHYTYSSRFIEYLRMVADKVEDADTKAPILENIKEESGNYEAEDLITLKSHGIMPDWVDKKAHKELIRHFLQRIDVDLTAKQDTAPGSRFTKYMLDVYSTSTACEGLAILGFAIEDTVSSMYQFIWDGLRLVDWLTPQDIVFFPLHILVDDGHADLLKAAYKKYLAQEPGSCSDAPRKVAEVLARRVQFLDEILALAESPTAPIEDTGAHISRLSRFSLNHEMLSHPFLQRMENKLFLDFDHAIRTFGREHYTYSRNFIKYLTAVADKIKDEGTRAPILENIAEESGNYEDEDLIILESHGIKREWVDKKPHKDLIAHFLKTIDVTINGDPESPGGRFTSYMLDLYAKSNACEGLAILGFAIEDTVSTLYQSIYAGLKKSKLQPQDYVFFPLHILVDDGHADLLKAAYKRYLDQDPSLCKRAPALVQEVLERRIAFLDGIQELADQPGGVLSEEAATAHVESLSVFATTHSILSHPFLERFSSAQFADFRHAIQSFAREHYSYSRHFITYLRTVVDKIPDDKTRAPILENISEESGNYEEDDLKILENAGIKREWFNKKPHKELITHFLKIVQVDFSEDPNTPGNRFTKYMLDLYANSNACEGLAILGFAIEETVSNLYRKIWAGLKESWLKPEDIVFFPLHILVDDGHAELLKAAYKMHLTGSIDTLRMCAKAPLLVAEVLKRRESFLDEIMAIADSPPLVNADVSQAEAIIAAQKKTVKNLKHPQYTLKQKIALSARFLHMRGQTNSLAGQVSCLEMNKDGSFGMRTLKYGIGFDEATPSNLVLVDKHLNTEDPALFPNFAIRFHIHIYQARPDVRCIVHTHPPSVNALGLAASDLEADHMDTLGLFQQVAFEHSWPGVPFGDEEGAFMVNILGKDKFAAVLAHHGMLTVGNTMEEALYRAFFLEENAALQLRVMSAKRGDIARAPEELAVAARKWRMSSGPVNAHFHYWARQVLRAVPALLEED